MTKYLIELLTMLVGLTLWNCGGDESIVPTMPPQTRSARLQTTTGDSLLHTALAFVSLTALPAAVTTYITTNYPGAVVQEAATDSVDNLYVVVIQDKETKALQFTAARAFVQELIWRDGHGGRGWGRHGYNGHAVKLTLSALPAVITDYLTTTYAGITINQAVQDSTTKDYVVFATVSHTDKALQFNADGSFGQEIRPGQRGDFVTVTLTDLPKAVTDYLTINYVHATRTYAIKSSVDGQYISWIQVATNATTGLLFAADGQFKEVVDKHK